MYFIYFFIIALGGSINSVSNFILSESFYIVIFARKHSYRSDTKQLSGQNDLARRCQPASVIIISNLEVAIVARMEAIMSPILGFNSHSLVLLCCCLMSKQPAREIMLSAGYGTVP